ncbi:NAD(P)/FAD-dependent oxidoreductase [Oryzibacter oryziterrae]|uniref:NAD(P)/FAD-dependent oxidoreductase n=1 Tax=Oryzibacter oryziterrae TaxID=2766474 RepID=UPI001F476713|nr:FAD-dependent oxidoreductase [Oryzibacter oryziterrae]
MSDGSFGLSAWQTRRTFIGTGPLAESVAVDMAIIGAGYCGLVAALHLARAGRSVQVIDGKEIGEGASGLNGGQVIPGLKYDPETLLSRFGTAGPRLVDFAASTADSVFGLIEREGLDVPVVRNGWIQAAHTETALRLARERDRQWRSRGADTQLLSAAEVAAMTGANGYVGGWLDRRAGTIDPLAYVTELARIAAEAGARIATGTQALRLERRNERWIVQTSTGATVTARHVVVATNAYSDGLVPGLARTLVPLHSFQVATAPLLRELGEKILPGQQAVSDSRRILVYYRKSPDGRLILGGRGRMSVPRSAADWKHLERALRRLYPDLADISIERRWFGRVGMTPDHLPHLHAPEAGLIAVAGCQGRGVGLMTALGQAIARHILSGDPDELPFPLSPIRPIPFHAFRQIGVAAAILWYRTLDAFEK